MSEIKIGEDTYCPICHEKHTALYDVKNGHWFFYCWKSEKVVFSSFKGRETFGFNPNIFDKLFLQLLKDIQQLGYSLSERDYHNLIGFGFS